MLNRTIVTAGLFTVLGAYFGGVQGRAEAAPIELAPVVITASQPDACTEFRINADGSADCLDGDIAGTYDVDHYAVEADTDGEGSYLVVWQ